MTVFFSLVWGAALHIVPANICAFAAGVTNSFFMNKHWSFRHRKSSLKTRLQLPMFLAVSLGGMALSTLTVWGLADVMPLALAKILATGVSFAWNFIGSRQLVYRKAADS